MTGGVGMLGSGNRENGIQKMKIIAFYEQISYVLITGSGKCLCEPNEKSSSFCRTLARSVSLLFTNISDRNFFSGQPPYDEFSACYFDNLGLVESPCELHTCDYDGEQRDRKSFRPHNRWCARKWRPVRCTCDAGRPGWLLNRPTGISKPAVHLSSC